MAIIWPPEMSIAAVSLYMLILPPYFFMAPGSTQRADMLMSGYSSPGAISGAGAKGPMISM